MKSPTHLFKAHSQAVADELVRLGWTLRNEFRKGGDEEPYQFILEWLGPGESPSIEPRKFETAQPAKKETPIQTPQRNAGEPPLSADSPAPTIQSDPAPLG